MIKAGFFKMSINPQNSVELWGFGSRKGKSQGILSDIFVKTLILENEHNNGCFILISLDTGGINAELSNDIKGIGSKNFKVPSAHICISTTHTHSAPALLPLRYAGTPDPSYLDTLKKVVSECVKYAGKKLYPIKIGYGFGEIKMGVNRRERGISSNINQKQGIVDNQLSVIRLDFSDGRPFVLLVNYAMHPVTLYADNIYVSADYPGELCKFIEQKAQCEAIFLQGACANVNPKIFGNYEITKQVGSILGEAVANINAFIETKKTNSFNIFPREINLPLETLPDQSDLQKKINHYQEKNNPLKPWEQVDFDWTRDVFQLLSETKNTPPHEIQIQLQLVQMDDVFLLFLPGEIFVETGLKLKHSFPNNKVVIVAYSNNGSLGYLPTSLAYREGGYEVDEAYKYYGLFRFASTAEERLVIDAIDLIKKQVSIL